MTTLSGLLHMGRYEEAIGYIQAQSEHAQELLDFISSRFSSPTLCGLLLAFGFLTRLGALVLMIISLVALFTVGLHHIPANLNLLTWYSWLLYLPESGYILMCLLLLVQGCGPWGIDRAIAACWQR